MSRVFAVLVSIYAVNFTANPALSGTMLGMAAGSVMCLSLAHERSKRTSTEA